MEGGGRGGGEAGFKEEQARVEKTLLRELRLPEDLCDSLAPISLAAGSEGGGGGGRMGGGQKKIAGEGKVTMESDALDANAVAVRKDGEGEDEVDVGEMAGKCLAALTACLGDSHMRFEEWDAVVDAGQRARARALTLRHARIMCKGSYLAGWCVCVLCVGVLCVCARARVRIYRYMYDASLSLPPSLLAVFCLCVSLSLFLSFFSLCDFVAVSLSLSLALSLSLSLALSLLFSSLSPFSSLSSLSSLVPLPRTFLLSLFNFFPTFFFLFQDTGI